MKRILSILLVALMLVGMLPMQAFHAHAATAGDTVTYTFSDYTAGTQYAQGEKHTLDSDVTLTINGAHLNTQVRLYGGSNAVLDVSQNDALTITQAVIKAGNKASTLTVSASPDGQTYTDVKSISTTSSYTEYTVSLPEGTKYVKMTSVGTAQIRVSVVKLTFGTASSGGDTSCAHENTTTTTVDATCTDAGSVTVTCDDCGETVSTETIESTGHNYVNGVCSVCQEKEPAAGTGDYVLVTSSADILSGGEFIITSLYGGKYYAVGTSFSSTTSAVEVTVIDSTYIAAEDGLPVMTLEASGNGVSIMNGSNYLAHSSSTSLKSQTSAYTWNIASGTDTNTFNLIASGATTRGIVYRSSASGFKAYAISNIGTSDYGSSLYLFKKTTESQPDCEHDYKTVVTAPTCTVAGYTTYTCSICGDSYTADEVAATGHKYTSEVTTAATCTEAGVMTYTCQYDNSHTYTETIPATGHTYVDGACSCGSTLPTISFSVPKGVEEVKSLTCDENTGSITLPSADDYEGEYTYTFLGWVTEEVNNAETAPTTILKAGDDYKPNNSHTLYAVYTYAVGGSVATEYVLTELANIGETDEVVIVGDNGSYYAMSNDNGTNSAPAAVEVSVDASGDVAKLAEAPAENLIWNVGGNATDGYIFYPNGSTDTWLYCTNTNNGVRVGTNTNNTFVIEDNYSYLYNKNVSRYVGVYSSSDWRCYSPAPTGSSNIAGQTLGFYVKANGGTPYWTTIIDTCDHVNSTTTTVDATCTEAGSTTVVCSDCGKTVVTEIAALGHDWNEGEVTTKATCETAGVKTYTCQNDKNHTKTEEIPALGHSWDEGEVTVNATCETDGEMVYTCQNDSSHTKTETIPALGHSYDANGVCSCGKKVSCFQLVTDYTEILAGGEYIIAAKNNESFYAINSASDSWLKAKSVEVTGTGADMMIVYADGMPIWNVKYFLGRNNCFSLYSPTANKYLAGTEGTSLSSSENAWAWTFIDSNNEKEVDGDGVFAVTQEDNSVAFVAASATVIDRAISLLNSSNFTNYSVRDPRNRELYFFKLVEANETEYTVKFVENGITTITQTVLVGENVLKMPQPAGSTMPEGYTKFVGWVELPHTESLVAPTVIYSAEETDGANNTVNITEDKTFYALYSREDPDAEGQALSYHLVTDSNQLVIGQKYIIVGLDEDGNYYAMSKDQLSGDRGVSLVERDADGVINFLPEDNVGILELTQGYVIGSFAFLDVAMNQFLYCASAGTENTLKSQATLDEKASFVISIATAADGSYSSLVSQITSSTRDTLMFNASDTESKMFSCYDPDVTDVDGTKTFLYVGVPNSTYATYYTTGLCAHNWVVTEKVEATCDHAGYTLETCSLCGEIRVTNAQAHGHDVGSSEVVTQPTCTTTGLAQSTCNNCGVNFDEIIPALGHTEVVDAAVAPTCTETGLTEGKHCSVCSVVLAAQQEVPATGHTYNEGAAELVKKVINGETVEVPTITYNCSVCGQDEHKIELNFFGSTVYMGNTLAVYYYTERDIDGITVGTTELKGFEDISVNFSYGERKVHYDEEGNQTNDYSLTVPLDDAIKNNESYYKFPCRYITPSQIGDDITAVISGTFNGTPYKFTMTGYSVKKYCLNRINASDSTEEEQKMLVDMLYYCDASRAYTTYKADESVTGDLKAYASAHEERVAAVTYENVLNKAYAESNNEKATWAAATIELYDCVRIRLRFEVADGVDVKSLTAKAVVGEEVMDAYVIPKNGAYYVYVVDLASAQMSVPVYVTLYEGDTAVSDTICYSVESYAATMLNNSELDAKLVTLLKAMMCYGDSAKAYFDSKN